MMAFIMWVSGGCAVKKEEEPEPTPDPKEVAKTVVAGTFGALFAAVVVAAVGTVVYVEVKKRGLIPEKENKDKDE